MQKSSRHSNLNHIKQANKQWNIWNYLENQQIRFQADHPDQGYWKM